MNQGKVEQVGTPQEVFDRPATPFVMGFLGSVNVFHGRVEAGRAHFGPLSRRLPRARRETAAARAGLRAPATSWSSAREEAGDGFWATLRHVNPAGAVIKLELEDGETRLVQVETTREQFEALHPTAGRAALREAAAGAHLRRAAHPARAEGARRLRSGIAESRVGLVSYDGSW